MSDTTIWVGIDLGLRRSCVCVVDAYGAELHHQECDTSLAAFKDAMAPFPVERIGLIAMEAGNDTDVARKLRDGGYPVAVFESRQASKFLALRRNKSDAGDARGLADLARLGRQSVSQVYLKSPECQQLRSLLIMRRRIVMMRVAADATVRASLGARGRALGSTRGSRSMRERVQKELAQLPSGEGTKIEENLGPLLELCDSLRAYLKKLDSDLEETAKSHAVCRLLMEVPGVGPLCAISFYTAIEDPSRFRLSTHVGAYLGLTPRRHQSGGTSRSLGITKSGSKLTRTHLVTAATVFGKVGPDCELKRWYLSLRDRAGAGRARIALARKLAVVLLTMWKDGTHFEAAGAPSGQGSG